jgi:hypothetical protein
LGDSYYECYPSWIVSTSIIQTFLSYALGALVVSLIGLIYALIFVVLVAVTMLMSPVFRCRYCYYYGKRCSFGLGMVAKFLVRKGPEDQFCEAKNVYLTAAVGFVTTALPIFVLAYLLFTEFKLALGIMAVMYVLVALLPGFFLRPRVFCKHCRQGSIGCIAYDRMKKGESTPEPT